MTLANYDPAGALQAVDDHTAVVLALMTLCLAGTFTYLVSAFRTARAHRAYPAPLLCVAIFAVHDASFVFQWDRWFDKYDHWWLQLWAVALIFTTLIELALVYQVYKYGREELMPRLSQREFGLAVLGATIGLSIAWYTLKDVLDDDTFMLSFAVTAWMPTAGSTLLLASRGSMRGQTLLMNWALLFVGLGLYPAWMIMDPYFREPLFIAFAVMSTCWSAFNLSVMRRYPAHVAPAAEQPAAPPPRIAVPA